MEIVYVLGGILTASLVASFVELMIRRSRERRHRADRNLAWTTRD
jgi:hypothetical protein